MFQKKFCVCVGYLLKNRPVFILIFQSIYLLQALCCYDIQEYAESSLESLNFEDNMCRRAERVGYISGHGEESFPGKRGDGGGSGGGGNQGTSLTSAGGGGGGGQAVPSSGGIKGNYNVYTSLPLPLPSYCGPDQSNPANATDGGPGTISTPGNFGLGSTGTGLPGQAGFGTGGAGGAAGKAVRFNTGNNTITNIGTGVVFGVVD